MAEIKDLKDELDNLESAICDLEGAVDEARHQFARVRRALLRYEIGRKEEDERNRQETEYWNEWIV